VSGFWGKFSEIEELVDQLVEKVEECLKTCLEGISVYQREGEDEEVKALMKRAHNTESEADEIRREIISKLLQGSLLPNTRGDLMALIENIDDIADSAEDILDTIIFPSLDLSDVNQEHFAEMLEQIEEQYEVMKKAVHMIFQDINQAVVYTSRLESIESNVDDLEENIIRNMAQRKDISAAEKLAYRDIVHRISNLADIIENVGDRIEIMVVVRKG